MKLIKLKIFILANLTLLAISAKAQLKVGNNPTIIGATSNLEIESSSGKKIVANKTTGGLSIDYTPSAASTDSVLLKNTPTGEIRQMSFARFKALYGGGSSSVSGACPGLGYTPNETAPTAPSSISVTPTINGTKAATTFAYNGHTYALYNLSGGVTWAQAQTAARNVGGYLAVITTANEWAYIYGTVLANTLIPGASNIWIGYRKYDTAGNTTAFNWINCEGMEYNQTTFSFWAGGFAAGEPNNAGGTEGCVHIMASGITDRKWNDIACGLTVATIGSVTANFNVLLVEFDQ